MASNYPDGVTGGEDYFNPPETIEDPWEGIEGDIKRLAVAQALQKIIGPLIKTKDKHSLRGSVDAYFAHLYEDTKRIGVPAKSFDVCIDGKKVGTYSITPAEGVEAYDETVLEVVDRDALTRWALEHGLFKIDMAAVDSHAALTGEIPDGMEPKTVHHDAVPGGAIKQTTLRIDPQKVEDALDVELIGPIAALMEGEE